MKEQVEFKKIREFGEIIGDTVLFVRQNFKPLMKSFLVLWGIFALGTMVSSIIAQTQLYGSIENARATRAYSNSPFNMFYNFGFNYAIVIFFMILSYTAMYVSILSYIAVYVQKRNVAPTLTEVWAYFKFYFLRMLGSGVLMSIFLILCFALCILPGLYVFPAVSLFYVVMIMENGGFVYSFERSFKLLKDEWWITAATIMVIWLITYACTMVIQIPAALIGMVSALMHAEQPFTASYAIITTVSSSISQVFLIIPIISVTLIYYNLVERKESSGLFDRIEGLGQNLPNSSPTENIPEEY